MNTAQRKLNLYLVTNCSYCGEPISQPEHGGRPRQYCDKPACRKAGSRAARKLVAEHADQAERDNLRLSWQQLDDPGTSAILEEILATYGTAAASLATEALTREREAMRKPAEWQSILTANVKRLEEKNLAELTSGQMLEELLLNLPIMPIITANAERLEGKNLAELTPTQKLAELLSGVPIPPIITQISTIMGKYFAEQELIRQFKQVEEMLSTIKHQSVDLQEQIDRHGRQLKLAGKAKKKDTSGRSRVR